MVATVPNAAESLRLRSVQQYAFARETSPLAISASKTTSSDTTLTAFCQLVTWRLNVQRAVVSLVGRGHQYFLAESTSTLDLANTSEVDENGASLWMGCTGSTSREHALCANTIKVLRVDGKPYAFFCVTDLSKDPVFSNLPYVAGPPYFKFYAGTPLISREGLRIGSLFAIDDRPREHELNDAEQGFLGIMAQNVMNHLEMQRDMGQQERTTTMSKGLAAFIEGEEKIPLSWVSKNDAEEEKLRLPLHTRRQRGISDVGSIKTSPRASVVEPGTPTYQPLTRIQTQAEVLSRASNIMRESLAVNYTVFLDSSLTISRDPTASSNLDDQNKSGVAHSIICTEDKDPSLEPIHPRRESREDQHLSAAVLSISTGDGSSSHLGSEKPPEITSMDHRFVQYLLRKYPSGVLWSFDENENLIQTEGAPLDLEENGTSEDIFYRSQANPEENNRSREAANLIRSFPNSRQILFAPIFDSATSHYICACFAVSLREVPVFSTEIEVSFVRGFLNSVAAEYDRVSAKLADRQKGDFISSVSHEFRTPLHGILASTSLLLDSELGNPQRNLCETIDSCGRTLFNTVSHLLDYTKMNNFNQQLNNPSKDQDGETNVASLHIYSVVDLAKLCEDALRVVYEGYINGEKVSGVQNTMITNVSLEIESGDWNFRCTPGAIQRIIMNLYGNSLKYTKSGSISCRIERLLGDASEDMAIVRIIVTDTGIGISDDFLRYKLYKPFYQESELSEGTGLGLNIVDKIVRSLNGTVEIKSRLNEGTQVTVELPLIYTSEATDTTSFVSLLQSKLNDETFALYGFESELKVSLRSSLRNYITSWFKMKVVDDVSEADFVLFDEDIPETALEIIRARSIPPRAIIAACDSTKATDVGRHTSVPIYTIAKPFGPNILSRALLAALDQSDLSDSQNTLVTTQSKVLERDESTLRMNAPKLEQDVSLPKAIHLGGEMAVLPIRNVKPLDLLAIPIGDEVRPDDFSTLPRLPRILCVDDNAINLKLLQAYLKKLKYTNIKYAVDGLEAYNAVLDSTEPFDIIFMDLSMPICDGFESTQKIRAFEAKQSSNEYPPASIIALTSLAADRDQNKAYTCGMDYYVTKPLALSHLKTLMEEWQTTGKVERRTAT